MSRIMKSRCFSHPVDSFLYIPFSPVVFLFHFVTLCQFTWFFFMSVLPFPSFAVIVFVSTQNPISILLTQHLNVASRHIKFLKNRSFVQTWFAIFLLFRMALNRYHFFCNFCIDYLFLYYHSVKNQFCIWLSCIGSYLSVINTR